jgi:hypothetical protein
VVTKGNQSHTKRDSNEDNLEEMEPRWSVYEADYLVIVPECPHPCL